MSAKNLDSHKRWRSRTVSFRMSEEEHKMLNTAVGLSGLTKQDFIIKRLLCKDIVVKGNPRVFKALRNELANVQKELQRIEAGVGIDDELLQVIHLIATTLEGMKSE